MSNSKFKWQVQAAAFSIFLLGLLGGALGLNAYQVWFGGGARGAASSNTRRQHFEQIFDQLELDEAQKADVQKVVSETRGEIQTLKKDGDAHVREIRARADERFKQVFNPEQYEKFARLRDEFRQNEKQRR